MIEDHKGHEIVLAYLNPGDFFGEIGLFDTEHKRSAFVRAKSKCEIAQISYDRLKGMQELFPGLLYAIASQLAMRLRKTSRKVSDLAFYRCQRSGRPYAAGSLQRTGRNYTPGWHDGKSHTPGAGPDCRLLKGNGGACSQGPRRRSPDIRIGQIHGGIRYSLTKDFEGDCRRSPVILS
jgi:hypothetical protein